MHGRMHDGHNAMKIAHWPSASGAKNLSLSGYIFRTQHLKEPEKNYTVLENLHTTDFLRNNFSHLHYDISTDKYIVYIHPLPMSILGSSTS